MAIVCICAYSFAPFEVWNYTCSVDELILSSSVGQYLTVADSVFCCVVFAGYAKIGSLVALSHDVCEVALDAFKIAALKGWRQAQVQSFFLLWCVITMMFLLRLL
jgi:hypothetical protein